MVEQAAIKPALNVRYMWSVPEDTKLRKQNWENYSYNIRMKCLTANKKQFIDRTFYVQREKLKTYLNRLTIK